MSVSARPSERPGPAGGADRAGRAWRAALLALALLLATLPAGAQDRAADRGSRSALTRLVESLVPGLTVEGLRGPLARQPGFTRLTLADSQGVWLEIEGADIAWAATALLRRQLHIQSLEAGRLVVHRPPVSDAPAGPPGP
jgi:translocation and assembly module TamB